MTRRLPYNDFGIIFGQADEEYVQVLASDRDAQTFTAVLPNNHSIGATVGPTIWPTAILNDGDSLAFDILAVAGPESPRTQEHGKVRVCRDQYPVGSVKRIIADMDGVVSGQCQEARHLGRDRVIDQEPHAVRETGSSRS